MRRAGRDTNAAMPSLPDAAEILDHTTNAAVVQLPGRRFPGLVVQGDTLNRFVDAAFSICRIADRHGSRDLRDEATALRDELRSLAAHYEAVLASRGISLPYVIEGRDDG
jgi:hypothetical protein